MSDPTIHKRDGWYWINRCPVCNAETKVGEDDLWWCNNGHYADYPNPEVLCGPTFKVERLRRGEWHDE